MAFIAETDRLVLRALESKDIKDLEHIWGDEQVMQYCGGALEGNHRLCRSIQYYETIEAIGGISAYAVELKENKEMIGICGFNSTAEVGVYELIYHFKKEYWSKGYATESCQAVIDRLKHMDPKVHVIKLIASVAPENKASGRVLEKCGFVLVGDKWFDDTNRFEPSYEYLF